MRAREQERIIHRLRSRTALLASLIALVVVAMPSSGQTALGADASSPCTVVAGTSLAQVRMATGYAIVVVSTRDPVNVTLQGFVTNSHTSAFELSVFGFTPVEITADPARIRAARAQAKQFPFKPVRALIGPNSETVFELEPSPSLRRAVAEALQRYGSVRLTPTIFLRDEATGETVTALLDYVVKATPCPRAGG